MYFDPPYAPLSATARFTSYTAASFSDDDQQALQALVVRLAERGCAVIVSNSTAALVTDLYRAPEARRGRFRDAPHPGPPGDQFEGGAAGHVDEFVISNVTPSG